MNIKEWHEKNRCASKPKAFSYHIGDAVRIRNDVGGKRKEYAGRLTTVAASITPIPSLPSVFVYRLGIDHGHRLWTGSELEPAEPAERG